MTGNPNLNDFKKAKEEFDQELHKRIEFITFHQNYCYEDFVQGLRPNVEDQSGNLSFLKSDGVFMRSCVNALFEYYIASNKDTIKQGKATPESLYIDFVNKLRIRNKKELITKTNKTLSYVVNKNDNLIMQHKDSYRTYIVSGSRLLQLYEAYPDINVVSNINEDFRIVIGGCNSTRYWAVTYIC